MPVVHEKRSVVHNPVACLQIPRLIKTLVKVT